MGSLEIGGVVGTWVAAFFGIVALVGIIGPILIWRASRSERHKALAAAANTDNEFITKGIHAGPNIWLLQRVKAPLLKTAPVVIDRTFVLDPNAFKEVNVETTWVSLGHLIKAYGVKYSRGDNLEIQRDRAFLPVHKVWLLAIGLIGRYGERKDKGKFRSRNRVVRLSTPSARRRGEAIEYGLPTLPPGDLDQGMARELHGVTGSFERISIPGDGLLKFASASKEDLRQQMPDVLTPKTLFMMASGLMPLWDGRFFSLAESSLDSDAFDHVSSDSDVEEFIPAKAYRGHNVRVPRQSAPYRGNRYEPHNSMLHHGPRAYQLLPASDLHSGRTTMARCFAADQDKVLVLSPVRDSHSMSKVLEEYDGRTYVPADSPWIRLPNFKGSRNSHVPVYVNRADAQEMAYSLLEMEWHPESYLIEGSHFHVGMHLLHWAAWSLSRVGNRIVDGISNIGLGALEQSKLAQSLELALRRLEKSDIGPDRSICPLLYILDKTLEALCQHNEKVMIDRMIGMLMMTNEEFQELFYQSLRHLKQATLSTIQIDVRAATISIPSAFGVLQTFPVDLDRMYPSHLRNQESAAVPYSAIVLACLKACVRSEMLNYRFDARPLMKFIEACPDVVLVQ